MNAAADRAQPARVLPGESTGRQRPASEWPPEALALAQELHRQLAINDRQWHALKAQRPRRAAEQVAAALVHLLAADRPAQAAPTEGRDQAITLLNHALAWLNGEVRDPGCPDHSHPS